MTDAVPGPLAAALERIAAPAPDSDPAPPADVTGTLASLWSWWAAVGAGRPEVRTLLAEIPDRDADRVAAVLAGMAAADRAVDSGATLLVPRAATRDDAAARSIISLLTRREASAVVHQRPGMTDRAWMDLTAGVRDRAATGTDRRGAPLDLLASLGTPAIAEVVGMLIGASARRTPCVLDGTDELAAALVADRLCYRAKGWWLVASDSPDPGRAAAIDRIDAAVGLPLGLDDDAGRGADAVVALLDQLTA